MLMLTHEQWERLIRSYEAARKEAALESPKATKSAHEELLERFKSLAVSFHHVENHRGYFTDCDRQLCEDTRRAVAKAEEK